MNCCIRPLSWLVVVLVALSLPRVSAQQPGPGEEYQYVVWFSYCDGKPAKPGTGFKTEAEAKESARNLAAMKGINGETLYCDVKVVRTLVKATAKRPGDVLKNYKDEIVRAWRRVTNAKQELLARTGQITLKQFNDVNKLIASFNQQYDSGIKQGWSSAFSDLGVQRVEPVSPEGAKQYTVYVYQQQGGQWAKDDNRSLVSDDLKYVQGYVKDVKKAKGWTAKTNAPEAEDDFGPGTYFTAFDNGDGSGARNWTLVLSPNGSITGDLQWKKGSGHVTGVWKLENDKLWIQWQGGDFSGTPKWHEEKDYRKWKRIG